MGVGLKRRDEAVRTEGEDAGADPDPASVLTDPLPDQPGSSDLGEGGEDEQGQRADNLRSRRESCQALARPRCSGLVDVRPRTPLYDRHGHRPRGGPGRCARAAVDLPAPSQDRDNGGHGDHDSERQTGDRDGERGGGCPGQPMPGRATSGAAQHTAQAVAPAPMMPSGSCQAAADALPGMGGGTCRLVVGCCRSS